MRQCRIKFSGKWLLLSFFVFGLLIYSQAFAGNLDPASAPGSTMKTLDQVEPRIPITAIPYTISESGSYYLTRNFLAVGTGITINADNVTIDLMGYTITGDGFNNSDGISIDNRTNVEVKNGTVRNFRSYGILANLGKAHRILHVRAIDNGKSGIHLHGSSNQIMNCSAIGNGSDTSYYYGIWAGPDSIVLNNVAHDNYDAGIGAGSGSTVSNNTATSNGGHGILTHDNCIIKNNTASYNGGDGISSSRSCAILGNTAVANSDRQISAYSSSIFDQNIAASDSGQNTIDCTQLNCTFGTNNFDGVIAP